MSQFTGFSPAKKFAFRGMTVNRPIDALPDGQFAYAKNIRSYIDGQIVSRPGLALIASLGGNYIHSGYTLGDYNPDSPGGSARFLGMDDQVWMGGVGFPAGFQQIDSGYSGNPMSFIASSAEGSNTPWLYVYDSLRQRKYSTSVQSGGVPLPTPIGIPQQWDRPTGITKVAGSLTGSYFYRFRIRDPNTGVLAFPGPPTYTTVDLASEKAVIPLPNVANPGDPSGSYTVDIFRFGGAINDWRLVGSALASGGNFTDDMSDQAANSGQDLDQTRRQPWITKDRTLYTSGAVTAAAPGTGIGDGNGSIISGAGFNPNWLPGTPITVVGGTTATLIRFISSSQIEVQEDLGAIGSANIQVVGALISGQPLPYVFGPLGSGQSGITFFGCGDPRSPGTIYWTNGNDPDTSNETLSLDITDESEPLQNGCIYNGRAYVWSSERMWELSPSLSVPNQFTAQVMPGVKGLASPWCFAVGDLIYYMCKDGIEATSGVGSKPISAPDLSPLMPHDSQPGFTVPIPNPENFGSPIILDPPDPAFLNTWRLSWGMGTLYFDYLEVNSGAGRTLVWQKIDTADGPVHGWIVDDYMPTGIRFHYWEKGSQLPGHDGIETAAISLLVGTGGDLSAFGGVNDHGAPINVQLQTGAFDMGDARSMKLIGDSWVNANSNGANITARLLGNNNASQIAVSTTLTTSAPRNDTIIDLNPVSPGVLTRTVGLWLDCTADAQTVEFYEFDIYYVGKPEFTKKRPTDWTDDGKVGQKYLRGLVVEANTQFPAPDINNPPPAVMSRTVRVEYDGGSLAIALTITQAGQTEIAYAVEPPVACREFRLVPTDANQWELLNVRWIWDDYPEFSTIRTPIFNIGTPDAKFIQGVKLTGDSANANRQIQIFFDGGQTGPNLPATAWNGKDVKVFPSPGTTGFPFIAHVLQLLASDRMSIFLDETEWIWEPVPDFSTLWQTQETDHDLPGYHYMRDARIAYQSSPGAIVPETLTITNQYGSEVYSLPVSTTFTRFYMPLKAQKSKWRKYIITSTLGVRLFVKDTAIRLGGWGRTGPWTEVRPFGDQSRTVGARI